MRCRNKADARVHRGLQVRYISFTQHRERSSIEIWFVLLLSLSLLLEYIPGGSGRTYHKVPIKKDVLKTLLPGMNDETYCDIYVCSGLLVLFIDYTK